MWKLLIADDEATIRRGLKHAVDWDKYSISVAGEAEDGEQALELAKEIKPHIMFVDICMPFLNGLELIQALEKELPQTIFILITGHDEFSYAQQAVHLKVFEYLLKPVKLPELNEVLAKAVQTLEEQNHTLVLNEQFEEKKDFIKRDFLRNWVTGSQPAHEYQTEFNLFHIKLELPLSLSVIKTINHLDIHHGLEYSWSDELVAFTLENIISDVMREYTASEFVEDRRGNMVLLMPLEHAKEMTRLIKEKSEDIIGKAVVFSERVTHQIDVIPSLYKEAVTELNTVHHMSPIVVLAKNYILHHYENTEITLQEVAERVQVSPTYLSKQFKIELGLSFIQYLTKVRIEKALMLMNDPYLKVYEISELVGYSTQHYFCNAFKKVVGVSPSSYRRERRA